ncbi:MAG: beta-lactamase family protein, partial [Ignavibacteriae bacterium]|nr:beta-lactamase family protein [Ignavibacteriota bacterium]
ILKLQSRGELSLDDKINRYLDDKIVNGLLVYKGQDLSNEITIRHLLSHTSGIPDYFQGKRKNGKSLENEISQGFDQSWTFEQVIQISKTMKPTFAPGTKGKALYSDTNFQLLGRIIEMITKKSYAAVCDELIFKSLNLESTFVYEDPNDTIPLTLYYKQNELYIPKAMSSFGPDGGIVSTNEDMLIFIEAFFTGKLFPKEVLIRLKRWNKIFFPLQAGVGIHRFKLPWIFNPIGAVPEFIGHSGLSGALAFYAPKKNLFVVGTVNQVAYPSKSFNTMVKLIQKVTKK